MQIAGCWLLVDGCWLLVASHLGRLGCHDARIDCSKKVRCWRATTRQSPGQNKPITQYRASSSATASPRCHLATTDADENRKTEKRKARKEKRGKDDAEKRLCDDVCLRLSPSLPAAVDDDQNRQCRCWIGSISVHSTRGIGSAVCLDDDRPDTEKGDTDLCPATVRPVQHQGAATPNSSGGAALSVGLPSRYGSVSVNRIDAIWKHFACWFRFIDKQTKRSMNGELHCRLVVG